MSNSIFKSPAYEVISVPIEKIVPNTYNPNAVAPPEMRLLYDSIKEDGYTMPIVCYYSQTQDVYVIVDGFHRYQIMLNHTDIYKRENGRLPVTVIDKPLSNRMASTIRHNRARGSHDVDLMSNIIKELHAIGRQAMSGYRPCTGYSTRRAHRSISLLIGLHRPGFPQRTLSPRPHSVLARGGTSAWGARSARYRSLKSLRRS